MAVGWRKRDHILKSNDQFVISHRGRIAVFALEDTALDVSTDGSSLIPSLFRFAFQHQVVIKTQVLNARRSRIFKAVFNSRKRVFDLG